VAANKALWQGGKGGGGLYEIRLYEIKLYEIKWATRRSMNNHVGGTCNNCISYADVECLTCS